MNKEDKLLVIELDSLDAVPNVYYKGEEIKYQQRIDFTWITRTDEPLLCNNPYINVQHMINDKEGMGHIERISYNEPIDSIEPKIHPGIHVEIAGPIGYINEEQAKAISNLTSVKPYSLSSKSTPNYKEAYEDVLDQCGQFIDLFGTKGASDEAIDLLSKRIDKVRSKIQRAKG
ncbi:hypothetical protein [Priestia aryabhattai]|uniref:hypothetical protein n=1 Tax=Priestia aryabhattai TaxID=412384 RepID=UPI002E2205B4|nr:hypothetical protein [Priestia aryabhattai]MED4262185.1 hypothetical protein [Priestia aryabhattai]